MTWTSHHALYGNTSTMCKWKCIHVVSGVCVGRFALCMHTRQDREEGVRCPDILPYFWWRHHMLWPWKANIFSYSMLWRLNVAADRDLYPWSTMDTCTLIFTPTLLTSTCMHFACMHMPAPTCPCSLCGSASTWHTILIPEHFRYWPWPTATSAMCS